jgi:hypothetical protein
MLGFQTILFSRFFVSYLIRHVSTLIMSFPLASEITTLQESIFVTFKK